jgi:NADPH-dependent 2,4-dienoyl-CoA reductase/sulfur reductase-like enzyme
MTATKQTPILIVGNGGAAAHGIMALREAGYDGAIDVISDVPGPPFNPMLLPYYLKGVIGWEQCFPFGLDFYEPLGVTCHTGSPAASLNAGNRELVLADGRRFQYDQCLVASGAGCIVPNLPGLPGCRRALTFRTRECGLRMNEQVHVSKSVSILGASLVGAKLGEVMAAHGLHVTLIDLADRLLPGASHPETSRSLQDLLEARGIDVRLSHRLTGVSESQTNVRLNFQDHDSVTADFACVCIGVRPNLDFVDRTEVRIETGIVVDRTCRSSAEGLYAAGDAAEGLNLLTGRHQWFGLWGKACYQGRTAGLNMAGRDAGYPGTLPEYITPIADHSFAGIGDVMIQGGDCRHIFHHDEDGRCDIVLAFQGGLLTGFNLIDRLDEISLLKTALIRQLDFGPLFDTDEHPVPADILSYIRTRMKAPAH